MDSYEIKEHDVLVIGAGGAGLRAAIEASAQGASVGLVCKSLLGKAHTVMAEGGMAASLRNADPRDNWEIHFRDTIRGGKHLNNWHLAKKLKKKNGNAANNNIVVIDKGGIASGASGIACGVVRNNYFQSAMRELMMHSIKVWESDPKNFSYHPVGYMQISPESMRKNVSSIYEQQKIIGYESEFIEGKEDSMKYMKNIFHDWQAKGITSVLHEKRGGYANNTASIYGLANKAESFGVRILTGTKVTGFKRGSNSKSVTGVVTSKGTINCEQVILGVGPWIKGLWDKLELPKKISIKDEKGKTHKDYPMWIYWMLTEGVLGVDPSFQKTDDGKIPPVIHVDSDAHLFSDVDGSLITDKMWGIYYKPDFNFNGVQGGTVPYKINKPADDVKVDPYGADSQDYQTGDEFAHMWCSALAHCQKRFKGKIKVYKKGPSGRYSGAG